jgi:hypothetical protein
MAAKKGLIVGIILVVVFFLLLGAGGVAYVGWRWYSAYKAAQTYQPPTDMTSTTPESMPDSTEAAPADATPEGEPSPSPEPEVVAEATVEPAAEATSEPTSAPAKTAAPKKTKPPKTASPPPTPTDEPTPEPKVEKKPVVKSVDISHVHGGLSKKSCSGVMLLSDVGFKYDASSSEDDRQDHIEYRFDQIKKVEMKDGKTVEIVTTDKKWTFKGEGLLVAKVVTHLKMREKDFAKK